MNEEVIIKEECSPEIFEQAMQLWRDLGLYRAHRGDDYAVMQRTLALGGRFIGLWVGEKLAGTAWLMYDGRRLHLHYMGVRTDYQGRGYSNLLMEKVLEYARRTCTPIKLEVHVENAAARHLYEKYELEYLTDYLVMIKRSVG